MQIAVRLINAYTAGVGRVNLAKSRAGRVSGLERAIDTRRVGRVYQTVSLLTGGVNRIQRAKTARRICRISFTHLALAQRVGRMQSAIGLDALGGTGVLGTIVRLADWVSGVQLAISLASHTSRVGRV